MSINEYLLGEAKARTQEVLDSLEKSLTIMVGIVTMGPIALFVFSALTNPYLSLTLPLFVSITVFITRRILMKFRNRLNNELLNATGINDGFINEVLGGDGSLIMSVLGADSAQRWLYLLRVLNNARYDLLDFLLSKELEGDLSKAEVGLSRYILAIRYSSDKATTSALSRGVRTIMLGYYVLLFAVPAVAKSLQFLGIHWNVLFVVMIQSMTSMALFSFLRIIKRDFEINVNVPVFFTVAILSILISLFLLLK
ncbi:hypothetical protein [Vulcanisaeta souniana]|uniref:Uncharacterized protein n=1 Tax=Vulcanisaeta souniana JCM 11219 TaxID=1293586 RepID=A0A830E4G4_9CREN|nr:hypothetical protein [Vulcanisaeta souniana]BDR91169.1 hypothetical protein Vsou_02620 [Vulcanisaeta souniana JCM 11219]GGI81435.1 hypothetical protein GCM10007112_17660 [Vulcanisaeta souniana JCM 11219]